MKENIIELKNGLQFYVLDEIIENDEKYIIAFQVFDDETLSNKFIISKVISDINENYELEEVTDNYILERLSKKIVENIKNE